MYFKGVLDQAAKPDQDYFQNLLINYIELTFPRATATAARPIKPPFLKFGFFDKAKSRSRTVNNFLICVVLCTEANSLTILIFKENTIF